MADEVEKGTSAGARPGEGAVGERPAGALAKQKIPYAPPVLRSLGRVADLTFTKSLKPPEIPGVPNKNAG